MEKVQHGETLRRVSELQRTLRMKNTPATRSLTEHLIDTRALVASGGRA
ncbi:hypothetical protein QMK19_30845 [Streptomyces sp. H10-C2]|nr:MULTISPECIES: hypothetical protein [unclassified Streptomyces]MDJ0344990.1 hypothetical protein [Streptomyces sp. PH10-H1]MDJ0373929.1 hypothetical protein [Streptomyces sp. H10-C2]